MVWQWLLKPCSQTWGNLWQQNSIDRDIHHIYKMTRSHRDSLNMSFFPWDSEVARLIQSCKEHCSRNSYINILCWMFCCQKLSIYNIADSIEGVQCTSARKMTYNTSCFQNWFSMSYISVTFLLKLFSQDLHYNLTSVHWWSRELHEKSFGNSFIENLISDA